MGKNLAIIYKMIVVELQKSVWNFSCRKNIRSHQLLSVIRPRGQIMMGSIGEMKQHNTWDLELEQDLLKTTCIV